MLSSAVACGLVPGPWVRRSWRGSIPHGAGHTQSQQNAPARAGPRCPGRRRTGLEFALETQSTHLRLIPCEKHAAIIGRQAARIAQRYTDSAGAWALRMEVLHLVEALVQHQMGECSEDQCIVGDEE